MSPLTTDEGARDGAGRSPGERTVRQFELINVVRVLLAFVLVHLLAGLGPFLWGTLVGGVLGILNLRAMVFVGRRIMRSKTRSRGPWMAVFALKLALLCTAVWLCLSLLPIYSLGFLVGFSTLLPATLVLSAVRALGGEGRPATGSPAHTHGERRL
jgi:hypothetical protein